VGKTRERRKIVQKEPGEKNLLGAEGGEITGIVHKTTRNAGTEGKGLRKENINLTAGGMPQFKRGKECASRKTRVEEKSVTKTYSSGGEKVGRKKSMGAPKNRRT